MWYLRDDDEVSNPRNIPVAAAASPPRFVSTDDPGRARGVAATRPQTISVAAAASPQIVHGRFPSRLRCIRPVTDDPRRGRVVAAIRQKHPRGERTRGLGS